ncbi:MAG: WYL domain-containing protein [Candidatus Coatesbacteria bacterium]|nr:MAG: WYL domain-containing protein [Candidatus Coatesbacteria bacterium]
MATSSYDAAVADARWVVFDLETTGLSVAEGARIVEIGALKLEGSRVTDHLFTLVDPEAPIPPAATAVHGLTDADVASQPKLAEAFPRFVDFAADGVLVAHNLPFDLSFVVAASRELALPPLANATVDLLGLARRLVPGLESYRLASLARAFDVSNPSPHRALGDVAVESQLLLAFAAAAGEGRTVRELVLLSRELPPEAAAAAEAVVALEWAAAAQETVAVIYRGREGETERDITPSRIKARKGVCYVAAYCHRSRARREFRLDRLALAPPEA